LNCRAAPFVCGFRANSCAIFSSFSDWSERSHVACTYLGKGIVIHRNRLLGRPKLHPAYLGHVTEIHARRFLSPEDVAEILSVSVDEIYALLTAGELLGIRVGARGQWRIEETQIELFIADAYEFESRAARWRQAEHANITEVADGRIL
jgi:excisionase family DNA binding protein